MNWNTAFFLIGYSLVFGGSVLAMLWWHRKKRKSRLPFGDQMRLLRGPGETQLKLVRKFDEDAFGMMSFAAALPALVGSSLLVGASKLPTSLVLPGVAVAVIAFITSFIFAARWFSARARESGDRYLGYFGERMVAEFLDPLKLKGWRIFHDIPAINNGASFNLDHVAVGPQGVFVIETKTYRKKASEAGHTDYKALFDGKSLKWNDREDNGGLEQAERNAQWLSGKLRSDTGDRIHVTPILTLPGWYVDQKPSRQPRFAKVTNPKGLPKFLPAGPAVLSDTQIAAVADRLDALCRDVEY